MRFSALPANQSTVVYGLSFLKSGGGGGGGQL